MRAPNLMAIRSTLFVALKTAALTTLTLAAAPTHAGAQATASDSEVLAQIDLFSRVARRSDRDPWTTGRRRRRRFG